MSCARCLFFSALRRNALFGKGKTWGNLSPRPICCFEDPTMPASPCTPSRLFMSLPVLMAAVASPHALSAGQSVSCTYVRVDRHDSDNPEAFVTRLKRVVARELGASGSLSAGYPKPCRWETATGRVTHCLPDASLSLDSAESLLLDEAGYTLSFRIIDFESPMLYSAEIYLLPTGPASVLNAGDGNIRFQRVQILGGYCDDSIRRALLAAGAVPLDE